HDILNRTEKRKSSVSSLFWLTADRILVTEVIGGGSAISKLRISDNGVGTIWNGAEHIHAFGNFPNFALSKDGKIAAAARSSYEMPPEIWTGPVGEWRQLTKNNTALSPSWGKAESLEWTNEGLNIQGWLLPPARVESGTKYPMIVLIHGGVDVAIAKYPIDPGRLGVTGWSYGGYMTMWTVTQTNRFRGAVAGAGIANWQSYYGQNLIDQWMIPFFGSSVYDDPAVYRKSSPIEYIKKVKTPTLVIVGERDAECPAPQSYEFWHALRTLGVPTQLVVHPAEGHLYLKPENQVDRLDRTIAWFDKYLK